METLPDHGTRYRYVKFKCRCPECRSANAKYKRDKVARSKASIASSPIHDSPACAANTNENITCGVPSSYEWFGCRGQACQVAERKRTEGYLFVRRLKVS